MRLLTTASITVSLLLIAVAVGAVEIAVDGKATAVIVTADEPRLPEQTAAEELATYLRQVTGGEFEIVREANAPGEGARIYVGATLFAAGLGLEPSALASEEWFIRTAGDALVLVGGGSRGTLYAVYHFLEDIIGVHWWSPWEESVPSMNAISVGDLDRHGRPVIRYRDIYMLYGQDKGHFAARNRLNRDGDAGIAGEYGGEVGYGPPYHVHTFELYFPPSKHFEQHPEWYSLINGERKGERTQLCLTNQELREAFLAKLIDYIETSRAKAADEQRPAPTVYSVSQNDWHGWCQCDNCQAISKAEGSECGPILDFVNYMADGIRDKYPDVYIDTLAYSYTQKAPATIKPRDNVIIRLCDTTSNFTRAITDPENVAFKEHLLSWAAIAKNLRIWDYAVTYAQPNGLPMPSAHTFGPDYRFYAEHNVEGVFTEHEYPVLADMRDFKVWMMMKMLENPYEDYEALVRTFTDGFYGPAGEYVREYLTELQAASEANISHLSMGASPPQFRYLDIDFVRRAKAIFSNAERAVADDPMLSRRVRQARLPLDRAIVITYSRLVSEWVAAGNDADSMPLDRDFIAARYRDTWYEMAEQRHTGGALQKAKEQCDAEIVRYTARKTFVPLPERFAGLPAGSVYQYTADAGRNWRDQVKVVEEPDGGSGITDRLELTDEEMLKYKLPMPWGIYDTVEKKGASGTSIKPEDVPGPGYHWYKMGTFKLTPSHYMYFFWSWIIQIDLGNVVDAADADQQWDIWARIKFTGPGFPHGTADEPNAIYMERVVLVKAGAE